MGRPTHTLGPWEVIGDAGVIGRVTRRPGGSIAGHTGVVPLPFDSPRADADARLIAAAPDHALLLAAVARGIARIEVSGERFCIHMPGLAYYTSADESGCPRLGDGASSIRRELTAALQKAGAL